MAENIELKLLEIPESTLAAARILGCDPQALMGLYDFDYFKEIEDNEIITNQMEEIDLMLSTVFDNENEEIREKIMKAMEVDPLFKDIALNFLIQESAEKIITGTSMLSDKTFESVSEMVNRDQELKKKMEEAIQETREENDLREFTARSNIIQIRRSLDFILQNRLSEELFEKDTYTRKIHELAFRIINDGRLIDFTDQEMEEYRHHTSSGPCSFCDLMDRREFSDFQEFLNFIKDAKEFTEIMINARDPKPVAN